MRNKTLPRLSSVFLVCIAAQTAQAETNAPITDVVLYPGSATIVRSVQIPAGNTQIEIPGLPARFDVQTLHADAAPGIRVREIVSKDVAKTEARSPAEAELENKIQVLQDQLASLNAEANAAMIVKGYLERLNGDGDKSHAAIDPKALTGMLDAISRGANDALAKIQKITVQKRDLDKKVAALQRDLSRLRSGDSDARTVILNVIAEHAGSLKLSYQINNAGWKPAYRASLDSASSKVELERLATISQKTGEDWSNVHLTLSTNQPRLSPTIPEPHSWLLSYRQPQAVTISGSAIANPALAYARVAAPAPVYEPKGMTEADEQAYAAPTFETQSTFSTEYEVPGRVNLLSDGREVSVMLAKQNVAVKLQVRGVPRMSNVATLLAVAEKPAGVWLPGTMQLLRDTNYVGAMAWNPDSKEHFNFSFGRDDLIRVENHSLLGDSASNGIFNKKSERRIADEYVISNLHKTPVNLEVLEAAPVSTSDEIRVQTVFNPKPTQDSWEQKRGVVGWQQTLEAGSNARFRVEYQFSYPQEGTVSGLNGLR